jgi:site-specific recombinase
MAGAWFGGLAMMQAYPPGMLALLARIDPASSDIDLLVQLVATLRPPKPHASVEAAQHAQHQVRTLVQLLQGNPAQASALARHILCMLASRRHTSLYTDIGIHANDGFFTDLIRRISWCVLPPALEANSLSDAIDQILFVKTDYLWIAGVGGDDWLGLFNILAAAPDSLVPNPLRSGILEAIRTLSYRICAIGLEPQLIRIHAEIERFESPFLMQNIEITRYLAHYAPLQDGAPDSDAMDAKHALVMLDQCNGVISKIRKNAMHLGTSIGLTYLLVALSQSIARLQKLLALIEVAVPEPEAPVQQARQEPGQPQGQPQEQQEQQEQPQQPQPQSPERAAAMALAMELIAAHNRKYGLRELFANNLDLLARNVTENASRTGEHYIAEDRQVTRAMFLSSAGAGLLIGFMAMLKILASYLRAAPLAEAFLYSLNYSFGFMLIHVLHFTVATKQPAMTASRIAASLHSKDGSHIDLDSMAELMVKVWRTQLVAVLGNLALAMPTAYLIALFWPLLFGQQLVSPEKAQHLLHDIDPWHGLALWYAMIAGLCLFLAGLISGYYDNRALYTRMAQRITQLRGLKRLLGQRRLARLGDYLEHNLGGLMGNFYFGILLGCLGTLGDLLGLPIEIRHITFSSANFATALVGLHHQIGWQTVQLSVLGLIGIGGMNLLVSFSLALWVALRSRKARFAQGRQLWQALFKRFLAGPRDFFIAPVTLLPEPEPEPVPVRAEGSAPDNAVIQKKS